MRTKQLLTVMLLCGAAQASGQEPAEESAKTAPQEAAQEEKARAAAAEPKSMLGMSILGNQEAPKSLVIVPWKGSEIGNGIGVSRALDTSIRAVDKDVFMRELKYYAIRSGSEK